MTQQNYTPFQEGVYPSDVLEFELENRFSREKRTVGPSQTLVTGQICEGPATAITALTPHANAVNEVQAVAIGMLTPVEAVNAVQTLDLVDAGAGSGSFTLSVEGYTTAAITYSATPATLVSRIQAAFDAVLGSNKVVVAGTAISAITVTFSGTEWSARPVGGITAGTTLLADVTLTINPISTCGVTAVTNSGTFVLYITMPGGAVAATTPLAYNASLSDINTAIATALGVAGVIVTGTAISAMVFTFSGTGYAGLPQPLVEVDVSSLVGYDSSTISRTTAGSPIGVAGSNANCVILENVTTGAGEYVDANFVVRDCRLRSTRLVFGTNCSTQGDQAAALAALNALGMLTPPVMQITTLDDQSTYGNQI
jgi:hypothetical protein